MERRLAGRNGAGYAVASLAALALLWGLLVTPLDAWPRAWPLGVLSVMLAEAWVPSPGCRRPQMAARIPALAVWVVGVEPGVAPIVAALGVLAWHLRRWMTSGTHAYRTGWVQAAAFLPALPVGTAVYVGLSRIGAYPGAAFAAAVVLVLLLEWVLVAWLRAGEGEVCYSEALYAAVMGEAPVQAVVALAAAVVGTAYRDEGWVGLTVTGLLVFVGFRALATSYQQQRAYLRALHALAAAVPEDGPLRPQHGQSVAALASRLAVQLGLGSRQTETVYLTGLLHDVGLLLLPTELRDPTKTMTEDAYHAYQQHAQRGADLLAELPGLAAVGEAVRSHHERWDGSGFPQGLTGTDIPLVARVVSVADHLVELLERNPGMGPEQLAGYLRSLPPGLFDPDVISQAATMLAGMTVDDLPGYGRGAGASPQRPRPPVQDLRGQGESQVMQTLSSVFLFSYEGGAIIRTAGNLALDGRMLSLVTALSDKALNEQREVRDLVTAAEGLFQVFCVPEAGNRVAGAMFDVTATLRLERTQEEQRRRVYRQVIAAVTGGRLLLLEPAELDAELDAQPAVPVGDVLLTVPQDIGRARRHLEQLLDQESWDPARRRQLLLCLSEVATNAVKHAGGGTVKFAWAGGRLRVVVRDSGPGINLDKLPSATLQAGFSTRASLGMGFSILLQYVDTVWLATGPQGTTVVLLASRDSGAVQRPGLANLLSAGSQGN